MSAVKVKSNQQLNIDLADLRKKISELVYEQGRHALFAFGTYSAPSEKTEKMSFDLYWELEEKIQKTLNKIRKIKDQLQ